LGGMRGCWNSLFNHSHKMLILGKAEVLVTPPHASGLGASEDSDADGYRKKGRSFKRKEISKKEEKERCGC
jgi:hypothetical protein